MDGIDKKELSESDICDLFITPGEKPGTEKTGGSMEIKNCAEHYWDRPRFLSVN